MNKYCIYYNYDVCTSSSLIVYADNKESALDKAESIIKSNGYIFYRIYRCEQLTEWNKYTVLYEYDQGRCHWYAGMVVIALSEDDARYQALDYCKSMGYMHAVTKSVVRINDD